ncbi:hypothetical protein WAI453_012088 [Rhynchosporium graminicola]
MGPKKNGAIEARDSGQVAFIIPVPSKARNTQTTYPRYQCCTATPVLYYFVYPSSIIEEDSRPLTTPHLSHYVRPDLPQVQLRLKEAGGIQAMSGATGYKRQMSSNNERGPARIGAHVQ